MFFLSGKTKRDVDFDKSLNKVACWVVGKALNYPTISSL
jgi:hypothetical protein